MNDSLKEYLKFVTVIAESNNQINKNKSDNISIDDTQEQHTKPVLLEEQEEEEEPDEIISIEESEQVFFTELIDIKRSTSFTPKAGGGPNEKQDSLPIHGRGRLDTFIVISNSSNFEITVVVDNREVVNETYTTLATISNELDHVSAYTRDNQFVVVVSDYPFVEGLHISVRPFEEIIFPRVRIEGILE